jgi:hypothetical protein
MQCCQLESTPSQPTGSRSREGSKRVFASGLGCGILGIAHILHVIGNNRRHLGIVVIIVIHIIDDNICCSGNSSIQLTDGKHDQHHIVVPLVSHRRVIQITIRLQYLQHQFASCRNHQTNHQGTGQQRGDSRIVMATRSSVLHCCWNRRQMVANLRYANPYVHTRTVGCLIALSDSTTMHIDR